MLSLGGTGPNEGPEPWKFLIYDKFGMDSVVPLLRVGALRNHYVSMQLMLDSVRHPVPEVPAVYLVEPTEENIARIIEDVKNRMYNQFYINFSGSIPNHILENFAKGVASVLTTASPIAQVVDRYTNFISLGPNVCSLSMPEAYKTLNVSADDHAIEAFLDKCATGIISAVVTIGALPVIRAAPHGAASMVARKVCEGLRALLQTGSQLAQDLANDTIKGARPVLILLDREMDMLSMLSHTWTYQSMIHDVLHMSLNKVSITNEENVREEYYLDTSDEFFQANMYEPFAEVALAANAEIEAYAKKKANMNQPEDINEGLAAAINALPAMTEKKRSIDMHTNLAMALLREIKERDLSKFYQLEAQWSASNATINSCIAEFRELLKGDKGTLTDKSRALLVLYLSQPDIPPAQLDELITELESMGGHVGGIKVLKHLASVKKMLPQVQTTAVTAPIVQLPKFPNMLGGAVDMNAMLGKVTKGVAQGLAQGLTSLKGILPSKQNLPILRVVKKLMENKEMAGTPPDPLIENYEYLDPKVTGGKEIRLRSSFANALVFVIGGGTFVESEALELFAKKTNRQIIYGATEIVAPEDFAAELNDISSAS